MWPRRRWREPAEVVVWRPPPYVLPVDTEAPEDYCGTPAERARWVEDARRRRELAAVEGERRAEADARAADRTGWRLRDEINRLAVEEERVGAQAARDVAAVAAEE